MWERTYLDVNMTNGIATVCRSGDDHSVIGDGEEWYEAEKCEVECKDKNSKHNCLPPNVTTVAVMSEVVMVVMMMIPFPFQVCLLLMMVMMGTAGCPAAKNAVAESTWPQKFCHFVSILLLLLPLQLTVMWMITRAISIKHAIFIPA